MAIETIFLFGGYGSAERPTAELPLRETDCRMGPALDPNRVFAGEVEPRRRAMALPGKFPSELKDPGRRPLFPTLQHLLGRANPASFSPCFLLFGIV